jgi:RNA polymerase sigma-70 factor, ECF subfamily
MPMRHPKTDAPAGEPTRRTSVVRALRPGATPPDAVPVEEIRGGSRAAGALLFDRYGRRVERLLFSLLGPCGETEDLLHEVFARALEGIGDLDDPARVRSWLTGIAVHTGREWIRRRVRRSWLLFVDEVPDVAEPALSEDVTEATRATFEVLRAMDADERVVFSLRFLEGMEMAEIALACDVSVSTAKRRLKEAERHFLSRARRVAALRPWIEEGRWASE